MSRFAVDSNILIAAAQVTDSRHAIATAALESRLNAGDTMVIPAHALLEMYAVLTRLPPPFRARPAAALDAVKSFAAAGDVVAMTTEAYLRAIERAAEKGIAGGATYDAAIAAVAEAASVDEIVTFNVRDFSRVTGLTLAIPR